MTGVDFLNGKSIYAIARQTGVSPATVSRVLNNNPHVAPATRNTVLAAIRDSGFVPSIGKSEFENVGVFIGSYGTNRYSIEMSPYCSEVISGLSAVFCKYEYTLSLFPLSSVPRKKDEFKLFCFKRHIGMAVFLNITTNDRFIGEFADILPVVCIGTDLNLPGIVSVRADNRLVTEESVDYLYSLGHRSFSILNVTADVQDHIERCDAIRHALGKHGIIIPDSNIMETHSKYDDLPVLLKKLIDSGVTAFYSFDNQFAIRTLRLLHEMNIRIPDDVSLIGFDDYYFAQFCEPPLTVIRQPIYELGEFAGNLLFSMLNNNPIENVLPSKPQLILRASTGSPSGKSK